MIGRVAQMVQCLPSKSETLSSNPKGGWGEKRETKKEKKAQISITYKL
jgi:hypothetical protein